MKHVCGSLVQGGTQLVYVMPNTQPPVTSGRLATEYRAKLLAENPSVLYLMTLYLTTALTPADIQEAFKCGVVGVKYYPHGLTTNSNHGVSASKDAFRQFYPVFETMQQLGMVLNLHGEVASDVNRDICVMNAEVHFLECLEQLHGDFPLLKIVLEHATTRQAVECVKKLGNNVACTITVHHLQLIVDDWAGKPHNYCKPVAKYPQDRQALRQVILEGNEKFFLGSDSAPHPKHKKECAECCAGVYTSAYLLPSLAHILDSFGALEKLADFSFHHGLKFYAKQVQVARDAQLKQMLEMDLDVEMLLFKTDDSWNEVELAKADGSVVDQELSVSMDDGSTVAIVPFMAGQKLNHKILS